MKLFDPSLNDLTPRHLDIYRRYQVVRTAVDFGAAVCFVIGSVFFFFHCNYSAGFGAVPLEGEGRR